MADYLKYTMYTRIHPRHVVFQSGVGLYLILRCVPNTAGPDDEEEEKRSELGKVADSFWLLIRVFALQGTVSQALELICDQTSID